MGAALAQAEATLHVVVVSSTASTTRGALLKRVFRSTIVFQMAFVDEELLRSVRASGRRWRVLPLGPAYLRGWSLTADSSTLKASSRPNLAAYHGSASTRVNELKLMKAAGRAAVGSLEKSLKGAHLIPIFGAPHRSQLVPVTASAIEFVGRNGVRFQ